MIVGSDAALAAVRRLTALFTDVNIPDLDQALADLNNHPCPSQWRARSLAFLKAHQSWANVIVYAFTLHTPCRHVLERGAQGTLQLLTTMAVVADVLKVLAQGHV